MSCCFSRDCHSCALSQNNRNTTKGKGDKEINLNKSCRLLLLCLLLWHFSCCLLCYTSQWQETQRQESVSCSPLFHSLTLSSSHSLLVALWVGLGRPWWAEGCTQRATRTLTHLTNMHDTQYITHLQYTCHTHYMSHVEREREKQPLAFRFVFRRLILPPIFLDMFLSLSVPLHAAISVLPSI